jgi:hypothetical protein
MQMQAQFAQQHAQARHGYYIGGPRAGPDAFKLTSTLDKCTPPRAKTTKPKLFPRPRSSIAIQIHRGYCLSDTDVETTRKVKATKKAAAAKEGQGDGDGHGDGRRRFWI